MTTNGTALFRGEVLRHRTNRLHGSVGMATPITWQVIGFLLLAGLVVAIAFLASASYARVETVPGVVSLDKGVATVVPSRSGIIAALEVKEGQRVRTGDVLVRVRSEEDMIGGETAPARIRKALNEQDARLAAQGGLLTVAADAEQSRLREQIAGLSAEITSLDRQISDQHRLVDVARSDYDGVKQVADEGFISRRDVEARETALLSRRQQLAQLQQARVAKSAAISEARRAAAQFSATAQAQIAGAQSDRATLLQRMAEADLARGYAITSPVDGIVTALTARPGQPASVEHQLMMIVPFHARSRVELYVPTAAAGFIRPGQEVRIAVDAFPYQQFGTIRARLTDVSTATVARQSSNGSLPVYLVAASLPEPAIQAFGRKQALLPGMTLSARIVTENRSLLEWLFQPVFAVRNR